jgi:putative acetyltransferase
MRSISQETPNQEEVRLLLRRSDEYSAARYPPESRYLVGAAALVGADVRFFVARVDKRAVGCGALVLGNEGRAEIKRMFVDPANRGHGIGRALLEAIEETARGEGVWLLQLETGTANLEAVELYRRCGYRERGPFGEYSADPFSVFMEKGFGPLRLATSK